MMKNFTSAKPERPVEDRRDPIKKFSQFLVAEGILNKKDHEKIEKEVELEVLEAFDKALVAELPAVDSITNWIYSPDVDGTAKSFDVAPVFKGEPKTMVEMVSATLSSEMARDERIVVFR